MLDSPFWFSVDPRGGAFCEATGSERTELGLPACVTAWPRFEAAQGRALPTADKLPEDS